jgi:hypothetical protein
MPLPPHRGYPQQEGYPSWQIDRGSAGHVLIGAAVGFTLGALLGAKANKNPKTTVGAVVIVGGFGALIGGFIGGSHNGPYRFAHHRRIYPPTLSEDKQADRSADPSDSHVKESPAERSASARPTSPRQAPVIEAPAPLLQLTPAVP